MPTQNHTACTAQPPHRPPPSDTPPLLLPAQQVTSCLQRIMGATIPELQSRYQYPTSEMVAALRQRASDLLNQGFEWTLQHGKPLNPGPLRYKWGAPCCAMHHEHVGTGLAAGGSGGSSGAGRQGGSSSGLDYDRGFRCIPNSPGHQDLPRGDPSFGGEWNYTGNDPGSYQL